MKYLLSNFIAERRIKMKKLLFLILLMLGTTAFAQFRNDRGNYALTTDTLMTHRFLGAKSLSCTVQLSSFTGTSVVVSLWVANDLTSGIPYTEPTHTEWVKLNDGLTHTLTGDTVVSFWIDTPVMYDYIGLKFDFTGATASYLKWKFKYDEK